MSYDLRDRVALVTGARRGIGAACALALARSGATVLVNSRPGEDVEPLVGEISADSATQAAGGSAAAVYFDVTDSNAVREAFESIGVSHCRFDILINNAGQRVDALAMRMTDAQWNDAMAVNLDAVFYCCREALGLMRKSGGSIVNISSVAAFAGSVGQANYSAAKAGVIGLTRSLALEYGGRGIRVNALVPGIIETAMTADLKDDYRAQLLTQIPLKRFGTPDEVAACAVFLSSDAASYVNGATLHVNGGGYPA